MQKIKIVLTSFIAILMCLGVFVPKGHAATASMRVQLLKMASIVYGSDTDEKKFTNSGWTYVSNSIKHTSGGLDAVAFKRKSPTYSGKYDYCFTFRGTKGGRDLLVSDTFEVVGGLHINQVPDSIKWVKSIISRDKNKIGKVYFTGHSLGGYLAAWAESEVVDGKIIVPHGSYTRTFNAPGINPTKHPIKSTRDGQGKYNNYIKNYAISRWTVKTGNYTNLHPVDPVFGWGNTLGKIVKCNILNNKYYDNPFNYHKLVRFTEIINTSNFPD